VIVNASLAKEWTKKAIVKSGALRFASSLAQPRAVILMYHSVQHHPEKFANSIGTGITHSAQAFEGQMKLLTSYYHPVSLEHILSFLQGERKLPPKAVAVTFDDGFADNCEIAAPILARYGIRAAFYLTAGLIGTRNPPWYCRLRFAISTTRKERWRNPATGQTYALADEQAKKNALLSAFDCCAPLAGIEQEGMIARIESDLDAYLSAAANGFSFMMNWNQAKHLVEAGHIVGSHTLTHPNLAHVQSEDVMRSELTESKKQIEEAIGSSVEHFSYPHPALSPQWNEKTVATTKQAGYHSAVTTTPGPVQMMANPLYLKRMGAPAPEHQFLWDLEWTFLGRGV
jgi:peptidoglycan/xylan/chitin deacetylase (PgdA/CDA1 family)